jgi:hypothetical protein
MDLRKRRAGGMFKETLGNFLGPISIRIEGPPSMIAIVADPFDVSAGRVALTR